MSRVTAPCLTCDDRYPRCRGQCEKYKAFKEEQVRDKEAYYKNVDNAFDRYAQMKHTKKKGKR